MAELECTPTTDFTVYPCGIDSSDQLPKAVDNVTPVRGEVVNRHREAIISIESELGINPSGTFATVRARLDALETGGGVGGGINEVLDEGISVATNVLSLNFVGEGVKAIESSFPGRVDISVTGSGDVIQIQETKVVGVNGETNFTLSFTPLDDDAVKLYVNGFKQQHGVDYTVSGTSLTYSGSPSLITSDVVEFWYISIASTAPVEQVQETVAVTSPGQTSFGLSFAPTDTNAVEMYVNGQKQQHGSGNDYTISGSTVTYAGTTLNVTDIVEFWYIISGVSSGGGSLTFSEVLSNGNTTGGTDIIMSAGDVINSASGTVTIDDALTVTNILEGTTSGIDIYGGSIRWKASAVLPRISIETAGDTVGKDISISAQSNNSASNAAGDLQLQGGRNLGSGADGDVVIFHANATGSPVVREHTTFAEALIRLEVDVHDVLFAGSGLNEDFTFGMEAVGDVFGGTLHLQGQNNTSSSNTAGSVEIDGGRNFGSGNGGNVTITAGPGGVNDGYGFLRDGQLPTPQTLFQWGTEGIAFFGEALAGQQTLTDSTTGSTDGILSAVSGTTDDTTINNNFAEIRAILAAHGLIAP